MKFKLQVLCTCFLLITSYTHAQKPISIISLKILNIIDTLKENGGVYKADYYLISGYVDNKKTQQYLDRFVENNKDSNLPKYTQYNMIFYKESGNTNVKNISANPRIVDRYSNQNDLVCDYWWSDGKFLTRKKFRKGQIIEPRNDIKVEDVKE